ncbi:MAG: SDR family NAD(P)-dependent oxidoreductase, partial [Acidobacteriaceae bacterium]
MNKGTLLKDKTALVTGASGGIGAATALALAGEGANILLHYNSNTKGAKQVVDQIRQKDVTVESVQADL